MLLFVGGAPRAGKGIITRRLLLETHLPYLSLDIVKMGLVNGVPDFGIDPEESSILVAEKLWPLVHAMTVNMIETGVHYIIEGEILPKHVHKLILCYPMQIKACFLGYTEITPPQKLREIREYSGHPNDWVNTYPDPYVLELIEDSIEFSRYLQSECTELGITYFDISDNFLDTLDRVVDYLRA
jgi:hypothetical protein